MYEILEVDDKWNILKCTVHRRRVQFFCIILAILVIAFFHETQIPMVDMKVQMHSNLSKKKIKNNIKSPSSMRNGRFNTSKYRGKLQKMGVLYIHSPKSPGPLPKIPKKI
jgi:hypothetical protein